MQQLAPKYKEDLNKFVPELDEPSSNTNQNNLLRPPYQKKRSLELLKALNKEADEEACRWNMNQPKKVETTNSRFLATSRAKEMVHAASANAGHSKKTKTIMKHNNNKSIDDVLGVGAAAGRSTDQLLRR